MKPSNDKIERYYFEQFGKLYSLPSGRIAYGDKPDVIVHGAKKVGIEITNFFLQSGNLLTSEQRQRPLRAGIAMDACRLYQAGGGKHIEITMSFDETIAVTSARRKTLPGELASFVRTIDGRRSGAIEGHLFRALLPEISSIYLNAREYPNAEWRIMQVHKLDFLSLDGLTSIVREKESKTDEYQACDALWLLVVVDAMDAAQQQEIRIDDLRVSSNIFERIIVFHTFGHIVEVKGPFLAVLS